MAIIRQYHKDTDTTYVYESESYWDPVKKQSRSKRKVIGKIDPATGEMIPTGRRGRKSTREAGGGPAASDEKYRSIEKELKEASATIIMQKEEIANLERRNRLLASTLEKIHLISSPQDGGNAGR